MSQPEPALSNPNQVSLDELVRDLIRVHPLAKSTVRTRLEAFAVATRQSLLAEIAERVIGQDDTHNALHHRVIDDGCTAECGAGIANELRSRQRKLLTELAEEN